MDSITVYTALYDLNRVKIDLRTFETYVEWLSRTIELFPGIVVFHDGNLDNYDLQNCRLIKVPLEDLQTFKLLGQVTSLLNEFEPLAPEDVTFKIPSYALLQFAKFEFAMILNDFKGSLMWVDAGISRFIDRIDLERLNRASSNLIDHGYDALFEIDIRNNLAMSKFSIQDARVGSCRRVISGGAFWINKTFLSELKKAIDIEMKKWIQLGIWDNEQVLLRKILPNINAAILYVPQVRGLPGCVPRSLSRRRVKIYKLQSELIKWMLIRGKLL